MHSKDWIPEFKSLFKKELENFIKFKRNFISNFQLSA